MSKHTIEVMLCSFCQKNHLEVSTLIAGPSDIFICDACVDDCTIILIDRRKKNRTVQSDPAAGPSGVKA